MLASSKFTLLFSFPTRSIVVEVCYRKNEGFYLLPRD